MGWIYSYRDARLDENELTAGAWEQIFLVANQGLPHAESEIAPAHCPTCRCAIGVVAHMLAGDDLATASEVVAGMSLLEQIQAFSVAEPVEVARAAADDGAAVGVL